MLRTRIARLLALAAVLAGSSSVHYPAAAVEVCGDGADNDANSLVDEGCNSTGVVSVCESPLSCGVAGAVAPKTGALVYSVMPDLAPRVAYGPGLVFRRTFLSQYDPGYFGGGASDYRDSLGYRWHHAYMGWLEKFSTPSPDEVVLHTTSGQDVLFKYSTNDGSYDKYSPQAGWHFDYLRQKTASGAGQYDWELRTLTGEVFVYDGSGTGDHVAKLIEVRDTLATPNKVTISYNGDGKVYQVTDASTTKYLQLEYFTTGNKLLRYVKYFTGGGSPDVTLELTYSSDKLASAIIGGTTVENYGYGSGSHLESVTDGGSKTVATFKYYATTGGKAIRVGTQNGDVGYTYGDSSCDNGNGTFVFFNRKDTTTCTTDAGCGSGNYCGGKDSSGNGTCYKARRCVSVTTPNEHLWKDVTPETACPSCAETEHYEFWTNSPTNDKIELRGRKSADDVKTSYEYNSNGYVVTRVENDDDYVATNSHPSGARVTYFKYDNSSFPGRVTEVRILSELKPGGACTASTTTDCKRTINAYTSDGLLDTVEEIGFTYNSSGSVTGYDFTTDYDYDSKGRLTKINGARPSTDDNVDLTYWASGNGLSTDYLKEVKRQKDATPTYVTTTYNAYELWGNSTRVTDPNSKSVCRTFDSKYGRVASSRIVVNGSHTDCATSGGNDETTSYTYDTHRRLTKITKPKGNCEHLAYDSNGRLSTVIQGDYNSGTGVCDTTGHKKEHTYDLDGRLTKLEIFDETPTVVRRQEYTYAADRRLSEIINPVDTQKKQVWTYDDDGVPAKVEFEDFSTSGAKTEWDVDNLNRTSKKRGYFDATTYEEFTLTPGVQLDLPTRVRDPATHDLDLVWDDLGRKVKQLTPEANTTFYIYDEASNLKTKVEDYNGADTKTSNFTYDTLNRMTEWDTGDAACSGTGGAEIQYVYDALGGETCPSGSTCDLLSGRLAYVKTQIYCDAGQSDKRFDQKTFYSYTEPGRIKEHTVKDDAATPRVGRVTYTYDKNGLPLREDYPAGATSGAVYEYGGYGLPSNDDDNSVIYRDTTVILSNGRYFPFGPLYSLIHKNAVSGNNIKTSYTRNLAYRLTEMWSRSTAATPAEVLKITFGEDARGRYTKRDFTDPNQSMKDMFFLYDDVTRATCRTVTSQSTCPDDTSTPLENITYNTSGDRSQMILTNAALAKNTYKYIYVSSTSDKLQCIGKGTNFGSSCTGTPRIDFAYDRRGNRTSDDDTEYTTDARTYTYDGRNNLITVSGKFWWAANQTHDYVQTNAYDERNRRIFMSFLDTTANPDTEAQWFYYYDQYDRLIQAKHTPNVATSTTYSVYQWYWLGQTAFLYYQLDYVSDSLQTTTRRYLYGDERGRPLVVWSWPTSGNTTRVWEVEPGLFGWDIATIGSAVYQPIRREGQLYDKDNDALAFDGSGNRLVKRPGISFHGRGPYDSFAAAYLTAIPTDMSLYVQVYGEGNPIQPVYVPDLENWMCPWGPLADPVCGDGTCERSGPWYEHCFCTADCPDYPGPCFVAPEPPIDMPPGFWPTCEDSCYWSVGAIIDMCDVGTYEYCYGCTARAAIECEDCLTVCGAWFEADFARCRTNSRQAELSCYNNPRALPPLLPSDVGDNTAKPGHATGR